MSIISMCETTAQHHSEGNPITIHFLRVKLIATNIMGVALNVIRVHPSGHFIATKGHIYVMHSFFMLLERVPADHSANGPTKTGNGCSEQKPLKPVKDCFTFHFSSSSFILLERKYVPRSE